MDENQRQAKRDRDSTLSISVMDYTPKRMRPAYPGTTLAQFLESPSPESIPELWFSIPHHPRLGRDFDTVLHFAIREQNTVAATLLISVIPDLVDLRNEKGVTPLILATQKNNHPVVKALLQAGANAYLQSSNGNSAFLQAAHFNCVQVLHTLFSHVNSHSETGAQQLLNRSNLNLTTPLMRAAQEGHTECVKSLLSMGAAVNTRNRDQLTALMLAAQRGHTDVCQLLVDCNAELNSQTNQHSTSLMLACRRSHVDTARVLITAGCELLLKDYRGRTALMIAQRAAGNHNVEKLAGILDTTVQVQLMRDRAASQALVLPRQLWTLHDMGRATPITGAACPVLAESLTLPHSVYMMIVDYFPPPHLWDKRLTMLNTRVLVDPTIAVLDTLDLMDEVLEAAGLLSALDQRGIPSPDGTSWFAWRHQPTTSPSTASPLPRRRQRVTTATVQFRHSPPTVVELRRYANYFQYADCVYGGGAERIADLASLVRRMHVYMPVDGAVAMDVVVLASQLVSWYHSTTRGSR